MLNGLRLTVLLLMPCVLTNALAETVYVAERIRIGLRAETAETSPVVKTIESDAALEVLQRVDRFAQVRDQQGAVGWIEARYLSSEAPARLQLAKLQEELTKTRAQLAETQAQLKKSQASLAEQTGKLKELEKNGADKTLTSSASPATNTNEARAVKPVTQTGYRFSFLWLAISFAMLGMGFVGGILWLRESIRRRSGGMYLRV